MHHFHSFLPRFFSSHLRWIWLILALVFGGPSSLAQITPIKDIAPGPASSLVGARFTHNGILQVGDTLLFWADDGVHGLEPWLTDGTEAGTTMLGDIWPGPGGSDGEEGFIKLGEGVIFAANDSVHGEELWRFDLHTGAISLIGEMQPGPGSAGLNLVQARCCRAAEVFEGYLYFSGTGTPAEEDYELWRTDGQTVERVIDIYPGRVGGPSSDYLSADPHDFVVYRDHLYFEATTEAAGRAIWRTTGEADSTELFVQISYPGAGALGWWGQRAFNDRLIFATRDYSAAAGGTGNELWVTDGNPDSTRLLRDIYPGGNGVFNHLYLDFVEMGDQLLFWGTDSTHGVELWRTDGTTAGTQLFSETVPGPSGVSTQQFYTTIIDSLLYIQLRSDPFNNGPLIWQSDGTPQGSGPITQDFLSPMFLPYVVEHEGLLFSFGDDDLTGRELYWSDRKGSAQLVQDLNPGPGKAIGSRLIKLGDRLIFLAYSPDFGSEWATVNAQTLSISAFAQPSVKLYPNPGRDVLRVEGEAPLLLSPRLWNLTGQSLEVPLTGRNGSWEIDTRALLPGWYLVEIRHRSGRSTWRRWGKQ